MRLPPPPSLAQNAASSANALDSALASVPRSVTPRAVIVSALVLGFAVLASRLWAMGVQRAIARQAQHGGLLPETRTRMIIIRRIVSLMIWLIAIGVALGQFSELKVLSASLLASAGVSGLIVGFAAQSMLGNAVAGVIIAFSQPIRIGDDVEFRGERGAVEDMTLFFTVLRLIDGKRLIVPNNVLSNEVLKNLTMGDVTRVCRVEVLIRRVYAHRVQAALLQLAQGYEALDPKGSRPAVYWVRLDERGALLRLQAPCIDGPAADRLAQQAIALAAAPAGG